MSANSFDFQGRAAPPPFARDLGHRAAEVQVDVVGVVLRHDDAHGFRDRLRIDAVELDGPRRLGLVMTDQPHRGLVALDQRARRDHLAHVQPAPYSRHSRRKAVLVMPAMGASTTGTSRSIGPMRRGGRGGGDSHGTSILPDPEPADAAT